MKMLRCLAWLALMFCLTTQAQAQTPPDPLYVHRADGVLIKLKQRVQYNGKFYYLYNEPSGGNPFNKKQSMDNLAVILGKANAKAISQADRSAYMKDTAGQGYSVKLPTQEELQAIFWNWGKAPPAWDTDALSGCCEFWSSTWKWNDHTTVTMWNGAAQGRWDTDERVVALEVKPMTPTQYEAEAKPARVLLLHGLFGDGDFIMGSSYFPDLPGWIREQTGQLPLIPKMRDWDIEGQAEVAEATIKYVCPKGCRWHVVGHSRGGLVARVLMQKHPEWIASITTVATPNRGCPLCDYTQDNPAMKQFISLFTSTGAPKQIMEMSQARMEEFNKKYPVGVPDGVKKCTYFQSVPTDYFHSLVKVGDYNIHAASIVGNRNGEQPYQSLHEFTAFWPNLFDPTYWMNLFVGALGAGDKHYSSANDGVVPQCSAAFGATGGEGLRLSAVDHNDTVYQLARMSTTRGIDVLKGHLQWLITNVK